MDTRKRLQFDVPGASVLVIERHHSYERGWNKAPRMYVDASEQFNVIEDLMNRHRRPYATWRKAVRKALAGGQHRSFQDGLVTKGRMLLPLLARIRSRITVHRSRWRVLPVLRHLGDACWRAQCRRGQGCT